MRLPWQETPERKAARLVAKAKDETLNWIAPDDTLEARDRYVVGDRHTRSLVVYDKPASAVTGWQGWLASLLLCDGGPGAHGGVRLSVTWRAYTEFAANMKLTMAETGHQAHLGVWQARGWSGGRKERNALRDVERVQQDLSDAATKLLAVSVLVTCEAPSPEGLEAVWREVTGLLTARMLHWRPLHDQHGPAFRMQTPAGDRKVWHPLTWDTGTLAASWPAIGSTVDMGVGPVWGTDAQDGRPIRYDPFDARRGGPPAPHVCVIGPTGGGKSVAFFTVIAEYLTLAQPPRVRIIDPKRDYVNACAKLDGTLIEMSEAAPVSINCFDLAPTEWRAGPNGPEVVRNVVYEAVKNVLGVVRLMCEATGTGFDPEHFSVCQTAIRRTYAGVGIDTATPATWDRSVTEVPTLKTLYDTLVEMSGEPKHAEASRKLAVLIEPYAVGLWAELFARPTTADLSNPVIVYDVSGLDKSLRPVAMHLIAALTWREARRDPRYTIFGMDEVTQLLRYPESGRLVADMYLLGRSAGLSAWSMAQRTGHYLATQEGQDVLANAHTVLLLRQENATAVAEAAKRFALSPVQAEFLGRAGVGQGVVHTATRGAACLNIDPCQVVLDWLPKRVTADTPASVDA